MQIGHQEHTLAEIIKTVVLPSIIQNNAQRLWVARPHWSPNMPVSAGVELTHKPILGERVAMRNRRSYGSRNIYDARWPEDDLSSSRAPKLYFILSYPAALQIADYVVHCLPGHILLVPQGIPFADQKKYFPQHQETLQIMPYRGGVLCWHTLYTQSTAGKPQVQEVSCSIPHSQVPFYLSQLTEESAGQHKYGDVVRGSWLKIIFSTLYRELLRTPVLQVERGATKMEPGVSRGRRQPIRYVEEYVRRNLREKLVIDDVARLLYMSRTAFTTQFRAYTGKTFNRYVQDLRFETACEFLREGDLGIHHVAAAAGLRPNRMRELFQERLGLTPSEFRRKNRRRTRK